MVISNKFAASILSVSMKMQTWNTTNHDYGCTTGRDGRLSSAMVNGQSFIGPTYQLSEVTSTEANVGDSDGPCRNR